MALRMKSRDGEWDETEGNRETCVGKTAKGKGMSGYMYVLYQCINWLQTRA